MEVVPALHDLARSGGPPVEVETFEYWHDDLSLSSSAGPESDGFY